MVVKNTTQPLVQTDQILSYLCGFEQVVFSPLSLFLHMEEKAMTVHFVQYSLLAKFALGPFLISANLSFSVCKCF